MTSHKTPQIYLASQSPRRKDLLEQAGVRFTCVHSGFDEASLRGTIADPREYVCANATQKGRWVVEDAGFRAKVQGPSIVISADTIVVLGDFILEKPKDKADAFRMLSALSDKTHTVYTSMSFHFLKGKAGPYKLVEETFATQVTFRPLTVREIHEVIASGEPMDKAGAYGIQGKGALLIERIEGCYYNVVGLPLAMLSIMLEKAGYDFSLSR